MSHILSMGPEIDSDDSSPVEDTGFLGGVTGEIFSQDMFMRVGADMLRRWYFKQDPFNMKIIAKTAGINIVYDMFLSDMLDFDFGVDILGKDMQETIMRNLALSGMEYVADMYLKLEKPKKLVEYFKKNFIDGLIVYGLKQILTVLMRDKDRKNLRHDN